MIKIKLNNQIYFISSTLHENKNSITFDIFQDFSKNSVAPLFRNQLNENDYSPDINKAEKLMTGFIRADNCSNWDFDPHQKGTMIHFCSKEEAFNIGTLLDICYNLKKEILGD